MARDVSFIEVQKYEIACQPSQSRQPLHIVSVKLETDILYSVLIVNFEHYVT